MNRVLGFLDWLLQGGGAVVVACVHQVQENILALETVPAGTVSIRLRRLIQDYLHTFFLSLPSTTASLLFIFKSNIISFFSFITLDCASAGWFVNRGMQEWQTLSRTTGSPYPLVSRNYGIAAATQVKDVL